MKVVANTLVGPTTVTNGEDTVRFVDCDVRTNWN